MNIHMYMELNIHIFNPLGSIIVRVRSTKKTRKRTPYVRRSSRGHHPDQIEPPPPTNTEYLDISYTSVSRQHTIP